jgi:hypothetical protein
MTLWNLITKLLSAAFRYKQASKQASQPKPSLRFCTLKWEKRKHTVPSFLSFKCPSEYECAFVTHLQVCTNFRRSFISAGRYSTGSLWAELYECDSKTRKFSTVIRASHWTRSCTVYLPQVLTAVCLHIILGVSIPDFHHSNVRSLKDSVHKNSLCISCHILSYTSIPTLYISLPRQC